MSNVVTGKISRDNLDIIYNALKCALAIKCDELLFDDFGISGKSIETNSLIIQPLPDIFEFVAMGIGRISDLHARMRLVIDDDTLTGSFEEFREGKVGKLMLKTKKTKMEFRCKDPALVKSRKIFKDTKVLSFDLNADAIRFMTTGSAAMKNKSVTFLMNEGEMFIRLIDSEGDVLDHLVTTDIRLEPDVDEDEQIRFSYDIPKLAPLLNAHRENTTVNISKRGVMNLSSDGFNIYLVPDL
jgi:hypothetical protein